MRLIWGVVFIAGLCLTAHAGPVQDEVEKLANEAKQVLAAHQVTPVSAEKYAQCIFSLERAQGLLESAGDASSVLAQEVNSTLFWAKRFSTIEISNELAKLRGAKPEAGVARPVKPVSPPQKPVKTPVAPVANSMLPDAARLNAAQAAFHEADHFATQKKGDPFAVALRWFQVASNFSGTEYALKALEKAQEAHARSAASGQAAASAGSVAQDAGGALASKRMALEALELKAETPEIVILHTAEMLSEAYKYDEAIEQFKASIKVKDTISAESRLGYTYFKLAQTIQEKLLPKYKEADDAYAAAYQHAFKGTTNFRYFDDRSPELIAARRRIDELRKESDQIVINYVAAQACFEKILKLVPGGKDFDAAAYVGISMAKRHEAKFRAKVCLLDFLKEYKPGDIGEQITFEYCKSELERIR